MSETKSIFAECSTCGERWKLFTVPIPLDNILNVRQQCPGCGEKERLFVCPTDGEYAVTEPRNGKQQ